MGLGRRLLLQFEPGPQRNPYTLDRRNHAKRHSRRGRLEQGTRALRCGLSGATSIDSIRRPERVAGRGIQPQPGEGLYPVGHGRRQY